MVKDKKNMHETLKNEKRRGKMLQNKEHSNLKYKINALKET